MQSSSLHTLPEPKANSVADFSPGMEVVYVAKHVQERLGSDWRTIVAKRDPDRRTSNALAGIEIGVVSSCNGRFVFVKYWPQLDRFGWEGTTSQATDPSDLIIRREMSTAYAHYLHTEIPNEQRRQHDKFMRSMPAEVS